MEYAIVQSSSSVSGAGSALNEATVTLVAEAIAEAVADAVASSRECVSEPSPSSHIPTSWAPAAPTPIYSTPSSFQDPCACSSSGYSGNVATGQIGCKQHNMAVGDPDFFCYVVGGSRCRWASPSGTYAGAFWIDC